MTKEEKTRESLEYALNSTIKIIDACVDFAHVDGWADLDISDDCMTATTELSYLIIKTFKSKKSLDKYLEDKSDTFKSIINEMIITMCTSHDDYIEDLDRLHML